MNDYAVPKVHPASREMLPDDPMEMVAVEIPGDPELMLRLMVEEYVRFGYDVDDILNLARDPNFVAFHGMWKLYGEPALRRCVSEIRSRSGVIRVKAVESEPPSDRLVQIDLPA